MEPEREVQQPWEELFDGCPCWKPSVKSLYDDYNSGGKGCPSNDQELPYGVFMPFLRNFMVHRAFDYMRLYIHFSGNSSHSVPSVPLDKCLGDELYFYDFPKTEIFR